MESVKRYGIVIQPTGRTILLRCDDGDQMRLETMQSIVGGYFECATSMLDPTWARELVERIVLVINEEGKLKGLPVNEKATELFYWAGMDVIAGTAILLAVRGDELIGFTKPAAETICKEWEL